MKIKSTKPKSSKSKKSEIKKININLNFFSYGLVPYNKVLKSLIFFLQRKLSSTIFNEVYKYFTNEIQKYVNTSSLKFLERDKNKSTFLNSNENKVSCTVQQGRNNSILSNFSSNNYNAEPRNRYEIRKKYIAKNIKPMVSLSYYHKFDNLNLKKNMSGSNFSNLNFKNLDFINVKPFSNKYSNIHMNRGTINKTISNSNSNSQEKDFSYANTYQFNNNISYTSNYKETNYLKNNTRKITSNFNNNKFKMNEKLFENNKILLNKNYNTINTCAFKNNRNNKFKKRINNSKKSKKENNSHIQFNDIDVKNKTNNNRTLTNIPHQTFNDFGNKKPNNINENCKKNANSNIKNTIVINNNIFKKLKIIKKNKKKMKIINIKLQNPKNNGGRSVLKPLLNSEEMLKKIKNSLDDDNLKVMLNFSYENFLSKESERESKEISEEY
jgi:hypothetical protein